jgi:PBP1b-binding outer membrane lipoprotein LpoB
MKKRIWYVLPAIIMLAGCADNTSNAVADNVAAPTAAPPQRVDAVSNVLGAKMDSMLASQRPPAN